MWTLAGAPPAALGATPGRQRAASAARPAAPLAAAAAAAAAARRRRSPRCAARTQPQAATSEDGEPRAAGGDEQPPADAAGGDEQPPADAEAAQEDNADYAQHCQAAYGKPGLIDFTQGVNGLPKATLQHPSGAACDVYLHGAAVTSWRHADGRELLHLREQNAWNGYDPINGGIQIAWPQYGIGPLPTHGFLHNLHWSVVDTAWREPEPDQPDQPDAGADLSTMADWRPTISLYADTDEEFEQRWPHKFEALYSVTLMQPDPPEPSDAEVLRLAAERHQPWVRRQRQAAEAAARASAAKAEAAADLRQGTRGVPPRKPATPSTEDERPALTPSVLRCLLQIHNCDEAPFTFTTALRTHFATRDIPSCANVVKTLGLRGKYILDYTRDPSRPRLGVEDRHNLTFGDMAPLNRLYVDCDALGEVLFCPGSPSHFNIANAQGFKDIAVVHPTGVAPRECRRFVSIASARAVRKVTLAPGETWVGEMVLTAHDRYWELPAWEAADPSGVPIPEQTPDTLQPRRASLSLTEQLAPEL